MRRLFLCFCLVFISCQKPSPTPEILQGRLVFLGDSITQDGRYVSVIEYELFKRYPNADFDLISIGLSSETVSGLTEPNHPYPRPCLLERLERALTTLKPQTVFACYGMNDGIYHPQDPTRMQAYKDGIMLLINAVRSAGAQLVILTPPIFDAAPIAAKTVGPDATVFGYGSPYAGYNDVLADYATWLQSLQVDGVSVIDLNGPMLAFTEQQRQTDPAFTLSPDGVHPQLAGHVLMAQQVLKGIGIPIDEIDAQDYAAALEKDELYRLVHERRAVRSLAWLVEIGFIKPGNYDALPVQEAESLAVAEKEKILRLVRQQAEIK